MTNWNKLSLGMDYPSNLSLKSGGKEELHDPL